MKRALYKMDHSYPVASILEDMRQKCGREFGVTLSGNRLTLRWTRAGKLVQVHMILENVDNGEPEGMQE